MYSTAELYRDGRTLIYDILLAVIDQMTAKKGAELVDGGGESQPGKYISRALRQQGQFHSSSFSYRSDCQQLSS